jgi:serine/threonine protein kinase
VGPADQVKVADFGLAKSLGSGASVTQQGVAVGTPWYMAPEQCAPDAAVDPRADLYALGATLFHALAGRPPFEADSVIDVLAQHLSLDPPRLDEVAGVSAATARYVDRLLAKEPGGRFADAQAALAALG